MAATERNLARARDDFRVFLWLIWRHLGLPDPTPRQYEIAHYLQHGPRRRVIMAFRGIGKSWITSAYTLWLLWNDTNVKVLVVSASKERSDSFSIFTKRLLAEVPFLQHLAPDPTKGDRDSNVAFDVRGARAAHAPSVKSVGITGQIAGSRADFIVCDDVEVPNNSETATQREKLVIRCAELGGAVLTPDEVGKKKGGVVFLGTYQVEDSLYNKLSEKGYELRIWPAEFPESPEKYTGRLAPEIAENPGPVGSATDPARFDTEELMSRRIEYGTSGYALQFMLDTSPSDEERNPLKLRDLIVHDVDVDVAPDFIVWSGSDAYTLEHLPAVGLFGDRFQGPMKVAEGFSPYTDTIMYIDPSGRGKDQTGYAILKLLNGILYLFDWGGLDGGYEEQTLVKLATLARNAKVNTIVIEDNFGDGMYGQLFRPVAAKVVKFGTLDGEKREGVSIEDHRAKGQKEVRAVETLEPVMAAHRLVVDEALVKRITRSKDSSHDIDAAFKSGFYQMTRLTREKGCLKFDDWIDALSGACRWVTERMGVDVNKESQERKAEKLAKELLKFEDAILGTQPKQPTWHGTLTKE